MDVKISQIMMGFDQCYLLQSDGVIMIDAGAPGKLNCFVEAMEKAQIPVHELRTSCIDPWTLGSCGVCQGNQGDDRC